jgi:hypothetical protein
MSLPCCFQREADRLNSRPAENGCNVLFQLKILNPATIMNIVLQMEIAPVLEKAGRAIVRPTYFSRSHQICL